MGRFSSSSSASPCGLKKPSVTQTDHEGTRRGDGGDGGRSVAHLEFEFVNLLFDLDRVFGLSDGSLPHAVRQQREEPLHDLEQNKCELTD